MKKTLIIFFATLTVSPSYAFERSENILLYEEIQTNREAVYMSQFAVQNPTSPGSGSSSSNSAASFVGNGVSTNNVTAAWGVLSGENGNYTFTQDGMMGELLDAESEQLSLEDFAITTDFTPDGYNSMSVFLNTSAAFSYNLVMEDRDWDEKEVNYTIRKYDTSTGEIVEEVSQAVSLTSLGESRNLGITSVGDTMVITHNGTDVLSYTDAGLSAEKTIDIGSSQGSTLENFTLKQ